MNNKYHEVITKLIQFRDKRDWKQFHNSKDLALALSIEAADLNELFLWKNAEEKTSSEKPIMTISVVTRHSMKSIPGETH